MMTRVPTIEPPALDVEERQYSRELLAHANQRWPFDAEVQSYATDVDPIAFDPEARDFPDHLIPFVGHPTYEALPPELRRRLASAAWLIYQGNTIDIETELVIPACTEVIHAPLGSTDPAALQLAMAHAMTDEGYHTILALRTCALVRAQRGLGHVHPRRFHLSEAVRSFMAGLHSEPERRIARVATACCTESHITEYLDPLTREPDLQPPFRAAVIAHAKDEWVHGSTFAIVGRDIYANLDAADRRLFKRTVDHVAAHFFRADMVAWTQVLEQLNDPAFAPLLRDAVAHGAEYDAQVDYTNDNNGLRRFYEHMGWTDER